MIRASLIPCRRLYTTMTVSSDFYEAVRDGGSAYKFYLDGEWKTSTSGKHVKIINPSTNAPCFSVQGRFSLASSTWAVKLACPIPRSASPTLPQNCGALMTGAGQQTLPARDTCMLTAAAATYCAHTPIFASLRCSLHAAGGGRSLPVRQEGPEGAASGLLETPASPACRSRQPVGWGQHEGPPGPSAGRPGRALSTNSQLCDRWWWRADAMRGPITDGGSGGAAPSFPQAHPARPRLPGAQAWARTPLWRRAEFLHRVAAVMRENAQPIADVLVQEVAKPAVDAYTGGRGLGLAGTSPAGRGWGGQDRAL